jgi:hypothetical protein
MDFEEIHGFKFGGKVYPTKAEAERAYQIDKASEAIESSIGMLAEHLGHLLWSNWLDNGDRQRTAKGICEDLFPIHQRDRTEHAAEFMRWLAVAIEEHSAFAAIRDLPAPTKDTSK